jgi:transaldolase
MQLWLDTCNFEVIETANKMGLIDGVTTNPKILKTSSLSPKKCIEKMLSIQNGAVCWQVDSSNHETMVEEALYFHSVSSRIIVKVPLTQEGLKTICTLKNKHIPTMATVIFDPFQVFLAFKAGASFAAAYIGRMEDARLDPFDLIKRGQTQGKIMAASLRSLDHVAKCIELNCACMTIGDKLFEKITQENTHTLKSLLEFKSL